MPVKNKAAQALGKLGGAKSGGMKTPAQVAARRENVKKATAARMNKSGPWHAECRDCGWRTAKSDDYDKTADAAIAHRLATGGHFSVRVKGFK